MTKRNEDDLDSTVAGLAIVAAACGVILLIGILKYWFL